MFASTVAVYGRVDETMHEGLPFDPDDPYGASKAAVEMDLKIAKKKFGLYLSVSARTTCMASGRTCSGATRTSSPCSSTRRLRGEPMSVWGEGKQVRAFSHVDDVAPVIARCAEGQGSLQRSL